MWLPVDGMGGTVAGCSSPVYFWEPGVSEEVGTASREDFSMEPSILNRGANIYSDIKYCMYSLRSSHSWTIIYRTHESIRVPPLKYPIC